MDKQYVAGPRVVYEKVSACEAPPRETGTSFALVMPHFTATKNRLEALVAMIEDRLRPALLPNLSPEPGVVRANPVGRPMCDLATVIEGNLQAFDGLLDELDSIVRRVDL